MPAGGEGGHEHHGAEVEAQEVGVPLREERLAPEAVVREGVDVAEEMGEERLHEHGNARGIAQGLCGIEAGAALSAGEGGADVPEDGRHEQGGQEGGRPQREDALARRRLHGQEGQREPGEDHDLAGNGAHLECRQDRERRNPASARTFEECYGGAEQPRGERSRLREGKEVDGGEEVSAEAECDSRGRGSPAVHAQPAPEEERPAEGEEQVDRGPQREGPARPECGHEQQVHGIRVGEKRGSRVRRRVPEGPDALGQRPLEEDVVGIEEGRQVAEEQRPPLEERSREEPEAEGRVGEVGSDRDEVASPPGAAFHGHMLSTPDAPQVRRRPRRVDVVPRPPLAYAGR